MLEERIPPHDTEAEKSVVGSLLLDGDVIYDVIEAVSPDDFYSDNNKEVYISCLNLYRKQTPINQVTVARDIADRGKLEEIGGAGYLSSLIASVPTPLHAYWYAEIVKRLSDKRRLISVANQINNIGFDGGGSVDDATSKAISLLMQYREKYIPAGLQTIDKLARDVLPDVELWIKRDKTQQGLPTGFRELDAMIDGFEKQKMYLFLGRPSMAKTQTILNAAKYQAQLGYKPAIFSLEQGKKTLIERLVLSEARIDKYDLRDGDPDLEYKFWEAWGEIIKLPIYINDKPRQTTDAVFADCNILKQTSGLDIVYFDYINLAGDISREGEIKRLGNITKNLRNMARILDVPIVATAQCSRKLEDRVIKRPLLTDIRDSGEVEQDIDVGIGLYRSEKYPPDKDNKIEPHVLEMGIVKNRDGKIGTIKIYYMDSTGFMGDLVKNV